MPMITVHTNKQLKKEEKALVGRGLGERITLLPGKSEASLMLEIQDGQEMFFRGGQDTCAFVEVRLFRVSPLEAKQAFTQSLCALLEEVGIPSRDVYLNFLEFDSWGIQGTLK